VQGYDAASYGRGFADVYDDWYADVSDVTATVTKIAQLAAAGNGRALELGVGTGRIAIPLDAAGVLTTGIDASAEMLDRLRAKPGGDRVATVLGDMADVGATGPFAVVFAAFNTFFNLTTREAQARCMAGVARVLEPAGRFAVEAFVPPDPDVASDSAVSARIVDVDRVVLTAARRDPHAQTIAGQHIEITEQGVRLRPWLVRYAAPRELDDLAAAAGLDLESRHTDWRDTPFDEASTTHVSVYRTARR
jgi:SAM-dependent methyltransferase